jgi:hypothetical protein
MKPSGGLLVASIAETRTLHVDSTMAFTLLVPEYAELQREMHDAFLVQHPNWIERDGTSSKCDDYDRRLAELLRHSLAHRPVQQSGGVHRPTNRGRDT